MHAPAPRPTPYALVFDVPLFQEEHFPRVARDEAAFGAAHDAAGLVALDAGEALLQAVLPEEAVGPAAAPGRAPGGASAFVVDRYAALLFAAYRYWAEGGRVHALDEAALRVLLEAPPHVGAWTLAALPAAGYVQLPRHLVWAQATAGEAAEPVDGFFWVRTTAPDAALAVVLPLGVRADRPGFSVLDASAPIPAAGHFADQPGRDGAADFTNFLPGGELRGLFGVRTAAEVLRLASLCLWHLDVHGSVPADDEPHTQVPADRDVRGDG